ncbi:hypothetical protein L596_012089 [Steinernema carpocapsae]|uniref:Uncharacterized protein n=1 Tax=Steinernema carpocapsae TaxID=34508 RepID=A0A4U5NVY5_STECR|nr:hypothetical protein L596_012089 [Steinernema carpocapsae]
MHLKLLGIFVFGLFFAFSSSKVVTPKLETSVKSLEFDNKSKNETDQCLLRYHHHHGSSIFLYSCKLTFAYQVDIMVVPLTTPMAVPMKDVNYLLNDLSKCSSLGWVPNRLDEFRSLHGGIWSHCALEHRYSAHHLLLLWLPPLRTRRITASSLHIDVCGCKTFIFQVHE